MNADVLIPQVVYWHRELPPANAEVLGEGVIEATSSHTVGAVPHGDELWRSHRYSELMTNASMRLEQEVRRRNGHYAHVLSESVATRRNDALGEAWLHGTFAYVLLADPRRGTSASHQYPDEGCQRKDSGR
jgi:hypothetical protein